MMRWAGIVALGALMALSGCALGGKALSVAGAAAPLVRGIGSETAAASPVVAKEAFLPAAIAAAPQEYRLVTVNALGLNEMAVRTAGGVGGQVTFLTQSGQQFTLQDDMLIATRGFGEDLLVTGGKDLRALVRAGSGESRRIIESLDSQGGVVSREYRCIFSPAGQEEVSLGLSKVRATRINEHCTSTSAIFENIYWIDNEGNILSSRQYVSPSVAYLRVNRL